MRGRKPAPTAVKIAAGVHPFRINRAEPKAVQGAPPKPEFWSEIASSKWDEMVVALLGMGVLTHSDADALANYCETWAIYREALADIGREGVVITSSDDRRTKNPAVQIQEQARKDLLKYQSEFGLTPSSRTRLKSNDKPADDLSDFMSS